MSRPIPCSSMRPPWPLARCGQDNLLASCQTHKSPNGLCPRPPTRPSEALHVLIIGGPHSMLPSAGPAMTERSTKRRFDDESAEGEVELTLKRKVSAAFVLERASVADV